MSDVLIKYGVSLEDLAGLNNKRDVVRRQILACEKVVLKESMLLGSKTDSMLANFKFSGKMLDYLSNSEVMVLFR